MIMTLKTNTTSILVAILALGLISSVVLVAPNVSAVDQVERGQDVVIHEKTKNIDLDLIRMQEIVSALDDPKTTELDKAKLYQEAKELRQKSISQHIANPVKEAKVKEAHSALSQIFVANGNFANAKIQDIIVGHGIAGDKFIVDIDPKYFTDKDLPNIIKHIRNVVGNDVDIEFAAEDRPIATACSQTGDCTPVQGGVKIVNNLSVPCTVGFQAKQGTIEGFITAGHCVSLTSPDDDVYQPTKDFFLLNKVGDTTRDGFVGSGTTNCDCAFVDADEAISDLIYSDIAADQVGSIVLNDVMTTKGSATSGGYFIGNIIATSYNTSYGGETVTDQFKVDHIATGGDSGGPTYEAGAQFPDLMGIVVATGTTYSVHSKASNIGTLSGVSWDFS